MVEIFDIYIFIKFLPLTLSPYFSKFHLNFKKFHETSVSNSFYLLSLKSLIKRAALIFKLDPRPDTSNELKLLNLLNIFLIMKTLQEKIKFCKNTTALNINIE